MQHQHDQIPTKSEQTPLTDQQIIENLTTANHDCVARTVPLIKMLGACRQQFLLYAQAHREKATPEGDQKAETNNNLANQIDQVLKEFRQRTEPEEAA